MNSVARIPNQQDRWHLARQMAQQFGKSFGALTTSGTAALDLALAYLDIQPGDRVGIPAIGCHEIGAAVIRRHATPVTLPVDDTLCLTSESARAAAEHRLSALVAVHPYGIKCDLSKLRQALPPKVRIIEDAAQVLPGPTHSEPSDVTITSFGRGKPINLGEGGAAFANSRRLEALIDRWSGEQRKRAEPVLPLALSHFAISPLERVWSQRMKARTEISERLGALGQDLLSADLIERDRLALLERDMPIMLPIWCDAERESRLETRAVRMGLDICRPHPISLPHLPMFDGLLIDARDGTAIAGNGNLILLDLRRLFAV